jgi:hypothetical protein
MTEPVKVLPMAKLLRLAREKEERERAARAASQTDSSPAQENTISGETIPSQTIVHQAPVDQTISGETIVRQDTVRSAAGSPKPEARKSSAKRSKDKSPEPASDSPGLLDVSKGYYPSYNDLSDRLIPELGLNPFEQSVLQRLYRLSRGWKSDECEVGLGTLAKFCVMSRSQVQRSVAGLIDKGLIVNLGPTKKGCKDGNRYRVLPGVLTIPSQTMVRQTIVCEERTLFPQTTVVPQTIVSQTTNKNNNKEFLNTHTQTPEGVRVGSRFSLDECRAYAESLRGEGIQNPGGYATTIHRSGEADGQIETFLNQRAAKTDKPELGAEQIQEQANVVVSMLQQGSTIEEVDRLLAGNFRPAQWRTIRSIALAQAPASARTSM